MINHLIYSCLKVQTERDELKWNIHKKWKVASDTREAPDNISQI